MVNCNIPYPIKQNDELSDKMFILKLILSFSLKISFWLTASTLIIFSVYCVGYTTLYFGGDIINEKVVGGYVGFAKQWCIFGCGCIISLIGIMIYVCLYLMYLGGSECYEEWKNRELSLPQTNVKQSEYIVMLNTIPEVITLKMWLEKLFPRGSVRKFIVMIFFNFGLVCSIISSYLGLTYWFGYFCIPQNFMNTISHKNITVGETISLTIGFSVILQCILALIITLVCVFIIEPSIEEWELHKQKQLANHIKKLY